MALLKVHSLSVTCLIKNLINHTNLKMAKWGCGKVPRQLKEFKYKKRVLFASNPGLPKCFAIILEE